MTDATSKLSMREIDPSIYQQETELVLPVKLSASALRAILLNQDGFPVVKEDVRRLVRLCKKISDGYSDTLLPTAGVVLEGTTGMRRESVHLIYDICREATLTDSSEPSERSVMSIYLESEFCALHSIPTISAIMKG